MIEIVHIIIPTHIYRNTNDFFKSKKGVNAQIQNDYCITTMKKAINNVGFFQTQY